MIEMAFANKQNNNLSKSEKEGIEKGLSMMLTLRQQIALRNKFNNEWYKEK